MLSGNDDDCDGSVLMNVPGDRVSPGVSLLIERSVVQSRTSLYL